MNVIIALNEADHTFFTAEDGRNCKLNRMQSSAKTSVIGIFLLTIRSVRNSMTADKYYRPELTRLKVKGIKIIL